MRCQSPNVRLRNEKRDKRVCDVQPLHDRDLHQERSRRRNLLLAESDVVPIPLLGMREHEPYCHLFWRGAGRILGRSAWAMLHHEETSSAG